MQDFGLPPVHGFLRAVRITAVPGPSTSTLDAHLADLRAAFVALGHEFTDTPDARTDAFFTTARANEPVAWRASPLFVGRKLFGLTHAPASYALVAMGRAEFDALLARFAAAIARSPRDPADFVFPGLAAKAFEVLCDQGERGGPMMCVARLLQAQTKSLRVLLVVGERPEAGYLFDLAGAFPRIVAQDRRRFWAEVAQRIATQLSTCGATAHRYEGGLVTAADWAGAEAPTAMMEASREFGRRGFFTRQVRIADLVEVPALTDAVAQQYSEGCFGTFDAGLGAQVVTCTGSQQPVAKSCLQPDDLAVLTGVVDGGVGAVVRRVEGLRNDPPSSEAVEFESIDARLPRVTWRSADGAAVQVPVVRSKLHGHRGIRAYDPALAEFVPLSAPYFTYLVSCSTHAQAVGIAAAFAGSRALNDPGDPRQIVFTVLPGHGLLMVEKWVPGKRPFQVLLEAMDSGRVEICNPVPQGWFHYAPDGDRLLLAEGAGPGAGAGTGGMPAATQAR